MKLTLADQLKFKAVMSLFERSVDGRNFVIPSYSCTLFLRKELRWSRLDVAIKNFLLIHTYYIQNQKEEEFIDELFS